MTDAAWCDIIDLRLEAAVNPGRPLRWGPLPPDEVDDSRLNYGRVFGPWEVPEGEPTDSLWTDLGAELVELQWTGGRHLDDTVMQRHEAAQLRATFHDPALLFDPTNYDSPYQPRTVPNTPVRLRGGYRVPPGIVTQAGTAEGGVGRAIAPGALTPPAQVADLELIWQGVAESGQMVAEPTVIAGPITLGLDAGAAHGSVLTLGPDGATPTVRTVTGSTPARRDAPTAWRLTWAADTGTLTLEALDLWPYGDWLQVGQVVYGPELLDTSSPWDYATAAAAGAEAAWARHCLVRYTVNTVRQFEYGAAELSTADTEAGTFTAQTGQMVTCEAAAIVPVIDPEPTEARTFAVLFGGYADDWRPLWSAQEQKRYTRLNATDGTKLLAQFDPVALASPVGNNETAAERITRVLDHAQWPKDQRDIQGAGVVLKSTDHAQPAWTELLLVADTDMGALWIDPEGYVAYRDGTLVLERYDSDPVATFGCGGLDVMISAEPSFDLEGVRNIVNGSNGTHTITVADEASYTRYRPRTYKRTDLLMKNTADLAAWCDQVLQVGAEPSRHIGRIVMAPTLAPASFRWLLIPDPLDIWVIVWTPPGDETAHTVTEQVTAGAWVHTVTPDDWQTTIETGVIPPRPIARKLRARRSRKTP